MKTKEMLLHVLNGIIIGIPININYDFNQWQWWFLTILLIFWTNIFRKTKYE